jgi:hypothetical protein
MKHLSHKIMNDLDPIDVPKIKKPYLEVKKLGKSDIEWSNPCGDQVTHFVGYIESLNAKNSY